MDWRIKLLGEKAVDVLLPTRLGRRIHGKFQSSMGDIGVWNEDQCTAKIGQRLKLAGLLCDKGAFQFDGAITLEVGTGWHAIDVVLFYLLGAVEIWTADQFPHLNERLLLIQIAAFRNQLPEVAARSCTDLSNIVARYEHLQDCSTLQEVLQVCNARYIAPSKFHQIPFPAHHFDVFYSHSTLQRVAPEELTAYLHAAHRALRPGGYSLHCIHHSDHNVRHKDPLSRLHYLRYSDWWYDLIQSKKYNYQNRMRHIEFIERFAQCGFETVSEQVTYAPKQAMDGLQLDKRFRELPEEDVRIVRTQLIGRSV